MLMLPRFAGSGDATLGEKTGEIVCCYGPIEFGYAVRVFCLSLRISWSQCVSPRRRQSLRREKHVGAAQSVTRKSCSTFSMGTCSNSLILNESLSIK